jgi:hypothetical protein
VQRGAGVEAAGERDAHPLAGGKTLENVTQFLDYFFSSSYTAWTAAFTRSFL